MCPALASTINHSSGPCFANVLPFTIIFFVVSLAASFYFLCCQMHLIEKKKIHFKCICVHVQHMALIFPFGRSITMSLTPAFLYNCTYILNTLCFFFKFIVCASHTQTLNTQYCRYLHDGYTCTTGYPLRVSSLPSSKCPQCISFPFPLPPTTATHATAQLVLIAPQQGSTATWGHSFFLGLSWSLVHTSRRKPGGSA